MPSSINPASEFSPPPVSRFFYEYSTLGPCSTCVHTTLRDTVHKVQDTYSVIDSRILHYTTTYPYPSLPPSLPPRNPVTTSATPTQQLLLTSIDHQLPRSNNKVFTSTSFTSITSKVQIIKASQIVLLSRDFFVVEVIIVELIIVNFEVGWLMFLTP